MVELNLLKNLNPPQKEAVEAINGPLLILAGPGSGKTRVIIHRIAYLVKVCGVAPHRIMAVTFTNKAAKEIKGRLFSLVGQTVEAVTLGTFHSICAKILRIDGQPIGLDRNLVIYDADDQASIIKRAMQELNIDPKNFSPRNILSAISRAKSQLIEAADHRLHVHSYFDEVVNRVYLKYQDKLNENNGVDFDDLLLKTVQLFYKHPDVLEKYSSRYVHILIDEFQDTNVVQYNLSKQLAKHYRNICVVGDPDQSIYSWRQADIKNILSFEKDYPDAKVVLLEQNYRSTQTILEGAYYVIAGNQKRKETNLWTDNIKGTPITMAEAYTEHDESQSVAREIERLTQTENYKLWDIAVMYRTNAQSRVIEESFLRYGIQYRLVGGTRFYERREVKDIISYLRLVLNPYDSVSLLRVINMPNRGIGQKTLDTMVMWAQQLGVPPYTALQLLSNEQNNPKEDQKHTFTPRAAAALTNFLDLINDLIDQSKSLDVVQLISTIADRTGYRDHLLAGEENGQDRWENVLELRSVATEYRDLPPEEGLSMLLEGVALVSDTDDLDQKANAVTLITLHQSKGLEYPVVFIVGLEEGILPHRRSLDDPDQMEEERRLCYVGMTRAKEKLYMLRAFRRMLMGATTVNPPSRFLHAIPSNLTNSLSDSRHNMGSGLDDKWWTPPPMKEDHGLILSSGDKVKHATFGEGIVISCDASDRDYLVTVAFKGTAGIKKLLLSYAPLEKII